MRRECLPIYFSENLFRLCAGKIEYDEGEPRRPEDPSDAAHFLWVMMHAISNPSRQFACWEALDASRWLRNLDFLGQYVRRVVIRVNYTWIEFGLGQLMAEDEDDWEDRAWGDVEVEIGLSEAYIDISTRYPLPLEAVENLQSFSSILRQIQKPSDGGYMSLIMEVLSTVKWQVVAEDAQPGNEERSGVIKQRFLCLEDE